MAGASDKSKHVAFVYDNATTGSDAEVSFAVIPGLWKPGEAVSPETFGMTVTQMREAVKEHGLPLKEVTVAEGKSRTEIDRGFNHLPVSNGALAAPARPSDKTTETAGGPIPAPTPESAPGGLLPLAAAHQARNTVLAEGGSLSDAAKAARAAGGEWGETIASATESAAAPSDPVASAELVDADEGEQS